MRWQLLAVAATMCLAGGAAGQDTAPQAAAAIQGPKISDLLSKAEQPQGPEANHPYAAVPPELDAAVRALAMDNFTSAAAILEQRHSQETGAKQRAQVAVWLGIAYGLKAMNYPTTAWETATSASLYLNEAAELDPATREAPDATRIMAEMVGHGWATGDPAAALEQAEQKAEQTRAAIDFYYAGVISRRLAARAWAHSDTSEQDKKTLSLFAKALARDPGRYESWSAYLPALLPVGMHELATVEAAAMYDHFQNLRTPLLADQGPAVLRMSNSSFRTVEQDEQLLAGVAAKWPDAPMPRFELAMRAIETSPPLALELFPALISDMENGNLKTLPREAGYYPSALYKYAFLLHTVDRRDEALEVYRKLKDVSPGYAEVNLNMAILMAQKADDETTSPQKVALLERAMEFAAEQEKLDYRGKSANKATEMRRKLQTELFKARQAVAAVGKD